MVKIGEAAADIVTNKKVVNGARPTKSVLMMPIVVASLFSSTTDTIQPDNLGTIVPTRKQTGASIGRMISIFLEVEQDKK